MDGHTVMWCVQCAVFSFKIKILHARFSTMIFAIVLCASPCYIYSYYICNSVRLSLSPQRQRAKPDWVRPDWVRLDWVRSNKKAYCCVRCIEPTTHSYYPFG